MFKEQQGLTLFENPPLNPVETGANLGAVQVQRTCESLSRIGTSPRLVLLRASITTYTHAMSFKSHQDLGDLEDTFVKISLKDEGQGDIGKPAGPFFDAWLKMVVGPFI